MTKYNDNFHFHFLSTFQMSHDHMAHMMNASGGHGAHEMHHGMDHSTMNHGTMDHDSKMGHQMGHGVHTMTKAGDMCGEGGHSMMMVINKYKFNKYN